MASRKLPEWMCNSKEKGTSEIETSRPSQLLKFTGRIIFIKDGDEAGLNHELGLLIKRIETFHEEVGEKFAVGFDIEWPVDLKRRFFGKVSLMQICPDESLCYIIQLGSYEVLPEIIQTFMSLRSVILVGNCIRNDVWKIGRDFQLSLINVVSKNVRDLGVYANTVISPPQTWSLQNLVQYCLKKDLDKTEEVRLSDWGKSLTKQQTLYAATDAYASLLVYKHLKQLETKNLEILARATMKKATVDRS
ncbi:Werner syndrome ATP-dependent helicase [Nilaparvata lugens]|uniref:Werner syndrome ATP-dependent helicase n=1 Tax=Nilaparvata lugens TaxID=108931 RepID=UPI00193D8DB8|nr:Werner syndrome ATP-dependent helicase [Nilaparvata lugens]